LCRTRLNYGEIGSLEKFSTFDFFSVFAPECAITTLKTEEPAELMRLLQLKSFEGVLLAGVADAVRDRLAGEKVESQVVKIELKAPHPETSY
jgi:hypothetical protein